MKRPPVGREGPIRNRITADFGSAPKNGDASSAIADGLDAGRRVMQAASATAMDAVEAGVQTAYTVCEEYLARGREEALRQQARSAQMDDRNRDQPFDAWSQAMGPMAPMFAPWMQMMKMWTDGMAMWSPAVSQMAQQWGAPGAWGWEGARSDAPVTIAVTSKTPVEVTAGLNPGAQRRRLTVNPLVHASDADAPPLVGTDIESEQGRVRLSVTVPKDQPGGTYRGDVVDNTGLNQGYVRVDVPEPTKPATRRTAAKKPTAKAARKRAGKKAAKKKS